MSTVQDFYDAINAVADFSTACEFDNAGLLIGDANAQVNGVLVALDATAAVISEAIGRGANLIVTHHPIIFHPLKRLTADMPAYQLARAGISIICAHTNLDKAPGGVNDILAAQLGLSRVETLEDGMVRAGYLPRGMTPPEFAYYAKQKLDGCALRYCDGGRPVERVAVCGGSGGSLLDEAIAAGCEAFVTGDVKHDVMIDAAHRGITLVDAGHFGTERFVVERLLQIARETAPDLPCSIAQHNLEVATTI